MGLKRFAATSVIKCMVDLSSLVALNMNTRELLVQENIEGDV